MRGSALRSAFRRSSLPWSYPCSKSHIVEPWPVGWVPLSDLALTKMVRAKGLEPPHLAILVPKTSASTNSATPAGAVGRVHDVTDCRRTDERRVGKECVSRCRSRGGRYH